MSITAANLTASVIEKIAPMLAKVATEDQVKALIANNNRVIGDIVSTAVTLGFADLLIQIESLRTQITALEASVQKAKRPATKAASTEAAPTDEEGVAPAGAKPMSNKRTYFISIFTTDEEYRKLVMSAEVEATLEEQPPIKSKPADKKLNAKAGAVWNMKKDDATFSADIKTRMDRYNASIKTVAA